MKHKEYCNSGEKGSIRSDLTTQPLILLIAVLSYLVYIEMQVQNLNSRLNDNDRGNHLLTDYVLFAQKCEKNAAPSLKSPVLQPFNSSKDCRVGIYTLTFKLE